ncbi:MAG: hypothetical protein A2Y77_05310 [Planctomycetes bacterium RBG_13_62_9]|nr:MAG: hypothetical protein A2Y77_05310 [Planctomycetes bacterium RBG_13_62_9]
MFRGLTRIEVLVTVLVGLFVLSLLPAASRHAKSDSARATCRANLAILGKAMLLYVNDYEDKFPRAGGRNTTWGDRVGWDARNRYQAFGLAADGSGGEATISSCFYLLVKYEEVAPKHFVCPGDAGTSEFKLADLSRAPKDFELIDAWDFGPEAGARCSYAYHIPFGLYALTTSHVPGTPVAADRNPWLKSPAGDAGNFILFKPDLPGMGGTPETARAGNSISHNQEGQNVLFVDGHVSFQERSYCGPDNDNIYTVARSGDRGDPLGIVPVVPMVAPMSRTDSVLVHDPVSTVTAINQAPDVDSKNLKQTAVVATLDCPLPEHKNAIWCSTFQMAWDQLKRDIVGEPIQLPEAQELANRLNQTQFPTRDIQQESYYAAAGFVKDGVIERIQKDMAKRFPSEPVPVFDERYKALRDVVTAYAYLNVDVGFAYPYCTNLSAFDFADSNGVRKAVTAFCAQPGARTADSGRVREQTEILYYEHGETPGTAQFAVDLSRETQPYQVILARMPRCSALGEAARTLQTKIGEFRNDPDYQVLRKLRPIDTLIVPDVLYKLTHHFDELLGKRLGNAKWREYFIFDALQKIDFTLSRTGVVLKSEARLAMAASRRVPAKLEEPRRLHFDRPFLICVKKREPNAVPFFLMWVDNAELMTKYQ